MATDMTSKEFLEQYGDVEVVFSTYYKYTFNYKGVATDGNTVIVYVGGDHNDIYRFHVAAGKQVTVKDLDPHGGRVLDKDGGEVYNFYDMY